MPAHDISPGPVNDIQCIVAKVQGNEWVGRELEIVVTFDGSTVRLRTLQRLALCVGDEVAIRLNLEHAQVFDSKTHRALRTRTVL